jgi:hypothetical protein
MSKSHENDPKSKPKTVRLLTKPPPRIRLGGMEPLEDMGPGEYQISCEGVRKKPFAGGWKIEVRYRVTEGIHTGTALRQWFYIDESGIASPRSRYALQCAVALGRPLDARDDPDNPSSIFSGGTFRALVGFRKTDKPRGGKPIADGGLHRKDSLDGLRVHELLARVEL